MTSIKNLFTGLAKVLSSGLMLVTLLVGLGSGLLLSGPVLVDAQAGSRCNSSGILPDFGDNCIGGLTTLRGDSNSIAQIIVRIANWLIFILAAVAVLFIVYGGFLYVTDDGSGTKAAQGKKIVINALIGLVVAIISFTLVTVVVSLITTLNVGTGGTGGNASPNRPTGSN